MAVVTAALFGQIFEALFRAEITWSSDAITTALSTSTYVPNQDTHKSYSDITNELATANGYTQPGLVLGSGKTTIGSAYTGGTNVFALDIVDAIWGSSTLTAAVATVYDDTSTDNTLFCYQSSDTDVSTTGGTFTVAWHADGILKFTVSTPASS